MRNDESKEVFVPLKHNSVKAKLVDVISVHNTLGEGVTWDHRIRCLWWTDIEESKLYQLDWDTKSIAIFYTPERLGSFGLTEDAHVLICAFESGLAYFSPKSNDLRWLHKLDFDNIRLNDGRVDRQGRFWVGSMVEHPDRENLKERAMLYCLNREGVVSVHLENLLISNGLAWSPEGDVMYFADTPTQEIRTIKFDSATGSLLENKKLARTRALPDGATVDRRGNLWSAQWGGAAVLCYSPEGILIDSISLPVSHVTCCCFAGDNMDYLCVSTARADLTEQEALEQPQAGNLFIFQTQVEGLREAFFPEIKRIVNT